jgi:glycosyltransferase involved in cell wall biosynthesis
MVAARLRLISSGGRKRKPLLWFWWLYGAFLALGLLAAVVDALLGMPQIDHLTRAQWDLAPPHPPPALTVVVPALNEQDDIADCLRSLAAQDYPALEIIAVDDRSTDRTGAIMDEVAKDSGGRIRVIHIKELPERWLGKPHALWLAARETSSEWLLFTDGDVIFRADALRRALLYAEQKRADHLVMFPTFIIKSAGEAMVLAVFRFSILAGRPWAVPDAKSRAHVGVGAFNLVRRSAYEQIGTFEALRLNVVEDLTLARRLKKQGFAARTAIGEGLVSIHWAEGMSGVMRGLEKNGFAAMDFRWSLAIAAVLFILAFHVSPFVLIWFAPGWTKLPFAICLACILALYPVLDRFSHIGSRYFLLHPLSATLSAYTFARAAVLNALQGGIVWRGTKYSMKELRDQQW